TLHYHVITHFPDKRTIYIDPVEKEGIATVRTAILEAPSRTPGCTRPCARPIHRT
ncbi:MAG: hypothetical protein IPG35_08730, partial [Flavobacteriales bacterium]|nr:hypothetical protein [Flavobacteriales bacterium]